MWLAIILGIPVGVFQVLCTQYYVSGLDKNNKRNIKKLKRGVLGLINVFTVISFIVGFAVFNVDVLLFAVSSMCGTMILFSIFKFVKNMNKGEES